MVTMGVHTWHSALYLQGDLIHIYISLSFSQFPRVHLLPPCLSLKTELVVTMTVSTADTVDYTCIEITSTTGTLIFFPPWFLSSFPLSVCLHLSKTLLSNESVHCWYSVVHLYGTLIHIWHSFSVSFSHSLSLCLSVSLSVCLSPKTDSHDSVRNCYTGVQ